MSWHLLDRKKKEKRLLPEEVQVSLKTEQDLSSEEPPDARDKKSWWPGTTSSPRWARYQADAAMSTLRNRSSAFRVTRCWPPTLTDSIRPSRT